MSDPVEPALTPQEWENPVDVFDGYVNMEEGTIDVQLGGAYYLDPGKHERQRKALAALLLRGYFTREDVTDLRRWAETLDGVFPTVDTLPPVYGGDGLRDLADRIEALLAPEEEG